MRTGIIVRIKENEHPIFKQYKDHMGVVMIDQNEDLYGHILVGIATYKGLITPLWVPEEMLEEK